MHVHVHVHVHVQWYVCARVCVCVYRLESARDNTWTEMTDRGLLTERTVASYTTDMPSEAGGGGGGYVVLESELEKRNTGWPVTFERRSFILRHEGARGGACLGYYKDKFERLAGRTRGYMQLYPDSSVLIDKKEAIKSSESEEDSFTFTVVQNGGRRMQWTMRCQDADLAHSWVTSIRGLIQRLAMLEELEELSDLSEATVADATVADDASHPHKPFMSPRNREDVDPPTLSSARSHDPFSLSMSGSTTPRNLSSTPRTTVRTIPGNTSEAARNSSEAGPVRPTAVPPLRLAMAQLLQNTRALPSPHASPDKPLPAPRGIAREGKGGGGGGSRPQTPRDGGLSPRKGHGGDAGSRTGTPRGGNRSPRKSARRGEAAERSERSERSESLVSPRSRGKSSKSSIGCHGGHGGAGAGQDWQDRHHRHHRHDRHEDRYGRQGRQEAVENPALDVGAPSRRQEDAAGRLNQKGSLVGVKVSTWGRSTGKGSPDQGAEKGGRSRRQGDSLAATNPHDSDAGSSHPRSPTGSTPVNSAPTPPVQPPWFSSARTSDAPDYDTAGSGGAGGGNLLEGLMEGMSHMSSLWRTTASSAGAPPPPSSSGAGETSFSSRTRHPQGNPPTLGPDVSALPEERGRQGREQALMTAGGRRGRDMSNGSGRWGVTLDIPDPRASSDPSFSTRRSGDLETGERGRGQRMKLAKDEGQLRHSACLSRVQNAYQHHRKTFIGTRSGLVFSFSLSLSLSLCARKIRCCRPVCVCVCVRARARVYTNRFFTHTPASPPFYAHTHTHTHSVAFLVAVAFTIGFLV